MHDRCPYERCCRRSRWMSVLFATLRPATNRLFPVWRANIKNTLEYFSSDKQCVRTRNSGVLAILLSARHFFLRLPCVKWGDLLRCWLLKKCAGVIKRVCVFFIIQCVLKSFRLHIIERTVVKFSNNISSVLISNIDFFTLALFYWK